MPMTINFNAESNNNINELALNFVAKNDNIHIIGVDRGERNLIYISVIDSKGNIIKQKSYNVVNDYDYKSKLKEREYDRGDARKIGKELIILRSLRKAIYRR